MKLSRSISIQASPEEIWESITQLEQIRKWNTSVLKNERISDGDIQAGFLSKTLIQEGKKEVWYDEEILEYTPHTKLRLKLSGGNLGKNPMQIAYELNDNHDQTKVVSTIEWHPSGIILKLLHRVIEKASTKSLENDLENLKNYLEQNPS